MALAVAYVVGLDHHGRKSKRSFLLNLLEVVHAIPIINGEHSQSFRRSAKGRGGWMWSR